MPPRKKKDPPPAVANEARDLSHITPDLRALATPLAAIEPDPQNAKMHDDASIEGIAASLAAYGQRKPIVVNRDTKLIEAGNGTWHAARQLGWQWIAVVWVKDDTATANGFAICDNRSSELSEWDQVRLDQLVSKLAEHQPDVTEALLFHAISSSVPAAAAATDLSADDDVDAAEDDAPTTVPETWKVVVTCKDEADQKALFMDLSGKGYKCKLITK